MYNTKIISCLLHIIKILLETFGQSLELWGFHPKSLPAVRGIRKLIMIQTLTEIFKRDGLTASRTGKI